MRSLVATQLQEMEMVRQKVYQLEQTQIAIKQKYVFDVRISFLGPGSTTSQA